MARVKGDKRAVELDGKAAEPDESPGGGLSRVERSARAQSLWITAARTLAAILTMAIPMVLVRLLDQTTFGHYKQLFLVAETVLAVLVLGLPGSLYYFVPREPEASQQFQTQTLFLLAGLGVAGGAAVLALAPWLGGLFDAPLDRYAGWIALYTALTIPASLVSTLPMVDRRARLAALLVMASDLARTGLLIAVAIATRDLTSILAAACLLVMVQVTAVLAYLAWRRRGQPWRPSWALLRAQLAYALPFAGAAMIGFAKNKIHAYYVAGSFSAAQFAIYAVATLNIPLIDQFSRTVGEVVVIENTQHHAAGRAYAMRRVWHRATQLLGLAVIPIFVLAEVLAPDIIVLLFGESYITAVPILRIYLLILPLSIFLGSPMLRATGDLGVMVAGDTLALVMSIVALLLLVEPLGTLGAVTSLVIGRSVFMGVAALQTARRLELSVGTFFPWQALLGILVASLIAVASGAIVAGYLSLPLLARLMTAGAISGGLYAVIAWWSSLIPETEKQMARSFWDRFRSSWPNRGRR